MKIGIVGLGLIGGSILKSLAQKDFEGERIELYAVTRNVKSIQEAKQYCVETSSDLATLSDCEVVFVAVPMSKVLQTLENLESVLPASSIVTDVSSLKSFVMQKQYSFNFIGSHPMAGTEFSGFEHSFKELFEGAKWVVTPHIDTSDEIKEKLEKVIVLTGAKVVYAEAQAHDEAVAKISHMPMLLAQALFDSVKDDKLALELAASGFRDMTRLAMSNIDMACDMVDMNGQNIQKALDAVNSSVKNLNIGYRENIEKIKVQRSLMYDKNGKNVFKF